MPRAGSYHARTGATVAAALTLALAACGSNGQDAEGDRLSDFLGAGDDVEAMQAQFEDEQRQVEEHIAQCMAEEGFEYIPQDPDLGQAVTHPRDEMEPDEFREEYGYGLTTVDMSEQMDPGEQPQDPNLEIQEEMDEAERQAYQEALQGEMPEPDPEADPEEPVEFEMGGCRGEAMEEVRGEQQALQEELGDDLQELYERVESDPRIVEARQGWSACIREAGWEFDEPTDTFEHLSDRQNELMQEAGAGEPGELPDELAELEPGEEPPEDIEMPEPPEPDPEALEELQDEEIELAQADHECQLEHFGDIDEETMQPELYDEVLAEFEAEFVEEHRDTLEELRDS